jgi:hypothetical protein
VRRAAELNHQHLEWREIIKELLLHVRSTTPPDNPSHTVLRFMQKKGVRLRKSKQVLLAEVIFNFIGGEHLDHVKFGASGIKRGY